MEVDKEAVIADQPVSMEVDNDSDPKVEPPPQTENTQSSGGGNAAINSVNEVKEENKDKKQLLETKNTAVIKEDGSEKSEPDLTELVRLSAGMVKEDDEEKMITITADEAKQYLLKKIGEYMNSSVNPLYNLRFKAKQLEEKGKEQVEEYIKLYKGLQMLQRKHEVFLRNVEILPKVSMSHVSVSADLPMEPVPGSAALMRKETVITKVINTASKSADSASIPKGTTPAKKVECIDLTDDMDTQPAKSASYPVTVLKHPAPLPPRPFSSNSKRVPPKPRLKISAEDRGIVLQWDMPPNPKHNPYYDEIATFEIFGYQEQKTSTINTLLWKKIGSVKAMSLPMACTLTQFVDGNKYHFAIRAVDVNSISGHYSDAISIVYKMKTK